jgi:hypothetical protein
MVLVDGENLKALDKSALRVGESVELNCTGMKPTASAERKWRLNDCWIEKMARDNKEQAFALCIEDKDCEDLERRKVYQVLPDEAAKREGYLRVIDESGEDYLYPESYFVLVQLPREAQEALQVASQSI